MQQKAQRAAVIGRRLRRWGIRLAAFYFGYKILHHQVFDVDEADPVVIALGLWMCGIAPADFFDGLRKLGDRVRADDGFGTNDLKSGGTAEDAA